MSRNVNLSNRTIPNSFKLIKLGGNLHNRRYFPEISIRTSFPFEKKFRRSIDPDVDCNHSGLLK
jgi:hypothetical protein